MSIYRCVCHNTGHSWKDGHAVGEVRYAYRRELPTPYAAGQFQAVGNPVSAITDKHYSFERLGFWRSVWVMRRFWRQDSKWHTFRGMLALFFSNDAPQGQEATNKS